MRDGRLGQPERLGQVAHACLAALVRGNHGHQSQPGGVGRAFSVRARSAAWPAVMGSPSNGTQQASANASSRGLAAAVMVTGPGLCGDGSAVVEVR